MSRTIWSLAHDGEWYAGQSPRGELTFTRKQVYASAYPTERAASIVARDLQRRSPDLKLVAVSRRSWIWIPRRLPDGLPRPHSFSRWY
jgi:hypothetical protein